MTRTRNWQKGSWAHRNPTPFEYGWKIFEAEKCNESHIIQDISIDKVKVIEIAYSILATPDRWLLNKKKTIPWCVYLVRGVKERLFSCSVRVTKQTKLETQSWSNERKRTKFVRFVYTSVI